MLQLNISDNVANDIDIEVTKMRPLTASKESSLASRPSPQEAPTPTTAFENPMRPSTPPNCAENQNKLKDLDNRLGGNQEDSVGGELKHRW